MTFFSLPKDTAVAKVCIAKLNREKNNLSSKVYACGDHSEDDCFDCFDYSAVYTNLFRQTYSKTPSPRSNPHKISTQTSKRTTFF